MYKICHMTSAHDSLDTRIFYKECVSLSKAGYETYLVAQGDSFDRDGVHIVGIGVAFGSRLERMTKAAKKVYETALLLHADLYHFHDPELLPYGLKLKCKGKRVIFDSHENYAMQISEKGYIPKPLRKLVAYVYYTYETYVLKRIDAVVVPCTFEGKNAFEGRAKRTAFIANYPLRAEFYDKFMENQPREQYVCYIGGLTRDRGILPLIEACGQTKTKLVLAGAFSPSALEQEAQAMPGYAVVDYRGVVSRSEVAQINAHAMAGACTLLKNGQYDKLDTFGIKVFEYMAMGLPVILTDYPYAREVLKKYRFGICVDPTDVQAITAAITYLRNHPEEAHEMGQNGRRAVEEDFNWATQEKTLLELYTFLEK